MMAFFDGWLYQDIIMIPMIVRLLSMLMYRKTLTRILKEEEQERDVYRSYIYAYLAISTAMVLALTIANANTEIHLNNAVFCAAISFIGFELSLSMQTYKFRLFSAQLIGGMLDVARLGIYLTIIAVLSSASMTNFSKTIVTLLAVVYTVDYIIKTIHNITVLGGYDALRKKGY